MWNRVTEVLPPEGEEVTVLTPGGDVRNLVYSSNLWWIPDMSMYCYFVPTHWREAV